MSKKIISLLLALMLTLSMVTIAVVSVSADTDDKFSNAPLKVTAKSNLFPDSVSYYNAETQQVTVEYKLQAEKDMVNNQWQLSYDADVLEVAEENTRRTIMPCCPSGTIISWRDTPGTITGNASDLGLYDITTEEVTLVKVVFNVVAALSEETPISTVVNLDVQYLTVSVANEDGYSLEEYDVNIVFDSVVQSGEDAEAFKTSTTTTPSTYVPEEPTTEEPTTEEPTTEEPTTEEPTTEEPTTEEPTTEEPTTEEPTTEEPTTEEPTTEEPTTEEPTTEAPTTEEPTTEEPTTEAPTTEEPTTEEPTTEEPTTEAPTTEEPTTEAPTTEEPTTEEPTTEAPTTEEPTTEEPTTEAPTTVYNGTLKVTATSNFFPETVKIYNAGTNQVTVRYYLRANKDLLNAQWTLKYDASVLTYSSSNKARTVMPNISSGAMINSSGAGEVKAVVSDLGLYDFSSGSEAKVFVEVVFDVADGVYSRDVETTVDLCIEELTLSLVPDGEEYENENEEISLVKSSQRQEDAIKATKALVATDLTPFDEVPTVEEETTTEEPTTEEPTTEEPTTEEPTTEEPTTEEPTTEEPTTEEPTTEEPTTEEPTTEEPTTEEPTTEEPTTEEPTTEEPTTEEPTTVYNGTLKVTATSNFFPETVKTYNAGTNQVTVRYYLHSNKDLLNAQWILTYDSSVLKYSSANSVATVMPNSYAGAMMNATEAGEIRAVVSDLGLYDFSSGSEAKVFVEVVFDVADGVYNSDVETTVDLCVEQLTLSLVPNGEDYEDESEEVSLVKNSQRQEEAVKATKTLVATDLTPFDEVPTVEEETTTEEPTTEEPTTEEPTTEEPTTEEPTTEEPTTEEPTTEEPTTEEPTTEEPTTEEPTTEEPTTEEPTTEEPTTEEPTTEEPTTEEPTTEEPTTEEPTTEEPTTEEPTTEEPTTEEPTTEEPTTEEPTTEEPTTVYNGTLKVTATSNFFPETVKTYNAGTNQVTVRYYLHANKDLLNTQWTLKYDPSVLTYSSSNSIETVMPNSYVGATINATNAGEVKAATSNLKLYDFSSGSEAKVFVEVVFDVADGVYSSNVETTVDLRMEELTLSLVADGEQFEDETEEVNLVTNSQLNEEAIKATKTLVATDLTPFDEVPTIVEEPTTEEPTTEEPTTEEPTTEEPTTEEPTTEEPTTEEPTTEEPTTEEPTTEEPTTEEPTTEEPTTEEPTTEEPTTEEPTTEGPTVNDVCYVTSTSNLFPKKVQDISIPSSDEETIFTVKYYFESEKSMLNTQWELKYDSEVLELVADNSYAYMPQLTYGVMYNATEGCVYGAYSDIHLCKIDNSMPFVQATFRVKNYVDTTVYLYVSEFTVSKLDAEINTSDETEEEILVSNGIVNQIATIYDVDTKIVMGGGEIPTTEEPTTEEPTTEEPTTEEPTTEEPTTEEPTTEEPTTEEPTTEEPTTEEPTTEEPTTEEPTTEEPTTEEPTTEEPTTEEPTTEEPATEEPTTEEPATGDSETTAPTEETTAVDATSSTGVQVDGTSTNDTPSGDAPVKTGDASMALIVLLALISSCTVAYFARKKVK